MFTVKAAMAIVLGGALMALVAGCPRRTEKIQVALDGSASIELEIGGEPEQFDALPSEATGWTTEHRMEKDGDKEVPVLEAKQQFAPGAALPSRFSTPDDPDADLHLAFPTLLTRTKESSATRYTFHRSYTPRRWAYVDYWRNELIDEDVRKIGEKPAEEITREERLRLIQSFAGFEAFKQLELAQVALSSMTPAPPLEAGLHAHRATMDFYEESLGDSDWSSDMLGRCEALPDDARDACLTQESQGLLARGHAAFVASLIGTSSFGPLEILRFQEAYARLNREYDYTKRIGENQFEVEITMPGTRVASNAAEAECDAEAMTCTAKWQFNGKIFRDRPFAITMMTWLAEDPDGNRP